MNKKVLAAAISAAVLAAPAVSAESVVYGKFHASIDNVDTENSVDNWQVNSRSSRLGFKGSEDLGGGLKAIYQLELSVDVTDGGGVAGTNRNTFIGLAGDWGQVRVGRHDTPAKMAFYAAGTDLVGDSIIDLNGGGGNPIGVFTERRVNDAIAYVSPNFSGFTVMAAVIPGEESGIATSASPASFTTVTSFTAPTTLAATNVTYLLVPGSSGCSNDNDGIADHYSLGLTYGGGGLKAGVGYEKIAGSCGADDDKMWQAGASYTMNNFTIGGNYEDREMASSDYTAWAVVGKAAFGNNAISLVYTDSENDPDGATKATETQGWGVAAEHNFSKRTKAYVAYASDEIDPPGPGSTDDDRFSLGMIHNF